MTLAVAGILSLPLALTAIPSLPSVMVLADRLELASAAAAIFGVFTYRLGLTLITATFFFVGRPGLPSVAVFAVFADRMELVSAAVFPGRSSVLKAKQP